MEQREYSQGQYRGAKGVFSGAIQRRQGGIQRGNIEEPRGYSQGQYIGAKGVFTGAIYRS